MYDRILGHRFMLEDRVRMDAYRKAILEVVQKGDVVADIGTGSGILAFFSIQAGAKKVYAIEKSGVIEASNRRVQRMQFAPDQKGSDNRSREFHPGLDRQG